MNSDWNTTSEPKTNMRHARTSAAGIWLRRAFCCLALAAATAIRAHADITGLYVQTNSPTEVVQLIVTNLPPEEVEPVETYRVAFLANGGAGKMAKQVFTYGKAQRLSANAFTKTGYVFAGWAKSPALADEGQITFKNLQAVKNLNKEGKTVELYAAWRKYVPKTAGRLRIALCQIPTKLTTGSATKRINRTFAWAGKKLRGKEDFIVFPEFTFATFKEEATAWRMADKVWKAAADFARKHDAWVFVNQPNKVVKNGVSRIYSETRVFSPDGAVAATYRKRVLAGMDKRAGYSRGPTKATMAKLPFAKVGILICKDAFCPKVGGAPYAKADVILVQFAHPGIENRRASEAQTFETPAGERKLLQDSRLGWKKFGKPYMAVNKTGPDGIYRLAGGTFAAKAAGKIVTKLETKAGVLRVDFKIGANGRIKPTPVAVSAK